MGCRVGHRCTAVVVAAALLGGLVAAWAGPFLDAPPGALPDEVRALADLRRLQVTVEQLPGPLLDAGVTEAALREQVALLLTDAGIELAESDAPMLVLKSAAMTEPTARGIVAYVFFMDFVQHVRVLRLGQDLVVPTGTIPAYAMVGEGRLAKSVTESVEGAVKNFLELEQVATRHRGTAAASDRADVEPGPAGSR